MFAVTGRRAELHFAEADATMVVDAWNNSRATSYLCAIFWCWNDELRAVDVGRGEVRMRLTWAGHATSSLFGIDGNVILQVLVEACSTWTRRRIMAVVRIRDSKA
jgi:hypothetical protein